MRRYDGKLALDNRDVARVLERTADLLEFKDENPFKLRSYRLAAEAINEMTSSVAEMAARGGAAELQTIPGIGKSISAQMIEIIHTGTSAYFEELKRELPETVLDLRRVSGIGLKTAQLLYNDFGIKSLENLKAFAEGGGLQSVPGLGEKTSERIKKSLERIESERGLMRLNDALDLARSIIERLKGKADGAPGGRAASAGAPRVECVGQVRRGREMVEAVEVLAAGDVDRLVDGFTSLPQIAGVKSVSRDRVEGVTKTGVAVVLHIAAEPDFAAALVRTTGAVEHLRDLEAEADRQGLAFEGFTLFKPGRAGGAKKKRSARATSESGESGKVGLAKEKDFYDALGLEFVPPEIREGLGEVQAAREGRLPLLISLGDIRGDFHMHTTWSDGSNSVREMIQAARFAGLHYMAITDHTRSSTVANGNTPEQLLEEIKEIEAVAQDFEDIRVFKGAEVDILSDGSLDMPFDVLDRLDWIVCSIHSGFHQERQQITDRVIRAMETGYPNVFAHPTGRILGERPPYEIDLEQVIAAAKQFDVKMELNASPYRLDLNSYWLRVARQAGVGIVISTDSHRTKGFASMQYGVMTARRAWLTAADVFNTLPRESLEKELKRKIERRR